MIVGKDNAATLLERELNKDRKNFLLFNGTGKESTTYIFSSERGPHSFIYSDFVKVYYYRLPTTVTFAL